MKEKLKLVEAHFNSLIKSYTETGEQYRATSFRTVLQMLKRSYFNSDIPDDLDEVANMRGV